MIIRIKKRDLAIASISLIFTLSIIFALSAPLIYGATTNTTTRTFGVWLVIANIVPNVTLNNVSIGAIDAVAASSIELLISFNVTDAQGVTTINASKTVVNITLGGFDGQWRSNVSDQGGQLGTCKNHTQSGRMIINCSVWLKYYDNASSSWKINVSVQDISGGIGRNDTISFTYNPVSAFILGMRGAEQGLNFSSVNPGAANQEAKSPLLLNNTGNEDFEKINITGADLIGQGITDTIAITAFAVNVTAASTTNERGMALDTEGKIIPADEGEHSDGGDNLNASLLHGLGSAGDGESTPYPGGPIKTKGNRTLTFWIDVPNNKAAGTYNNTWNITVVDLP